MSSNASCRRGANTIHVRVASRLYGGRNVPPSILMSNARSSAAYFASSQSEGKFSALVRAPGKAAKRKHPAVAVNSRGEVLLAWTESMGWEKGGAVAWQVYDAQHKPIIYARGRLDERLARLLLRSQDRLGKSMVCVTHEALASMLGVRRSGVSTTLKTFEREGLVTTFRKAIRIDKRGELQTRARRKI